MLPLGNWPSEHLRGNAQARGAHYQRRRDDFAFGARLLCTPRQLQGDFGGTLTELLAVLVDATKWNPQKIGVGEIAATHHGDVFRNAQSSLENGPHPAHPDGIVEAEDPVGPRLVVEQLAHAGMAAALAAMVGRGTDGDDVTGERLAMRRSQRTAIAFEPSDGGADVRPANVSDAPAALLDKVPRGQHACGRVVDADKAGLEAGDGAVDKDVGHSLLFNVGEAARASLRGGDEQYVDLA